MIVEGLGIEGIGMGLEGISGALPSLMMGGLGGLPMGMGMGLSGMGMPGLTGIGNITAGMPGGLVMNSGMGNIGK